VFKSTSSPSSSFYGSVLDGARSLNFSSAFSISKPCVFFCCVASLTHFYQAITQFTLLADESSDLPSLSKHRLYANFHLSRQEWDRLEHIRDALREPSNVQQTFSSKRTPTVWRIVPSFEFLIARWDTMASTTQHQGLKHALNEGVKSLEKWYERTDGLLSPVYFICLGKSLLFYIVTSC
jgi:hypothetical protein